MKNILVVCLATLLAAGAQFSIAQAQPMQKGVSVEMALTTNATTVPGADDADAWIVTIDASGQLYFGTTAETAESLKMDMIQRPRIRQQNLYIKTDARTTYANVISVLQTAREMGFQSSVLLTAQHETAAAGTIIPPRGLEVLLDRPDALALTIEVSKSGQLKIDGKEVNWASLQSGLGKSGRSRSAMVKADGTQTFAQVARVLDACRAAGAKVVLDI